jgi:hypothetical protein
VGGLFIDFPRGYKHFPPNRGSRGFRDEADALLRDWWEANAKLQFPARHHFQLPAPGTWLSAFAPRVLSPRCQTGQLSKPETYSRWNRNGRIVCHEGRSQ